MTDTIGNGANYSAARNGLDMISGADGTATTLLFSEKCGLSYTPQTFYDITPGVIPAASGVSLAQMTPAVYPNAGLPTQGIPGFGLFVLPTPPTQAINTSTIGLNGSYGSPSSTHPGGVIAVFCDGHTTYLRDSIDITTYAQLLTSNSRWDVAGAAYTANGPAVKSVLIVQKLLSENDFN